MRALIVLAALLLTSTQVQASDDWTIQLNATPTSGTAPLTVNIQTTVEETPVPAGQNTYLIKDYLPLTPGNSWVYSHSNGSTSTRYLENDYVDFSGSTAIKYSTDSYEYTPYLENGSEGLRILGNNELGASGVPFEFTPPLILAKKEMNVGDVIEQYYPNLEAGLRFSVLFEKVETIALTNETYEDTLKFNISIDHGDDSIDDCEYDTLIWYVKNLGIVKIDRQVTQGGRSCDGCLFICREGVDYFAPAELQSATIDGSSR